MTSPTRQTRFRFCLGVAAVAVSCVFSAAESRSFGQANPTSRTAAERFDELDARYWKILTARPRRGSALERWYRHWADAGRETELLARVKDEVTADPQNASLQLLWGLLLERRGDFAAAQEALNAAAELASDDYYPHFALGSLAAQRGELDEAAAALRQAGELEPPKADWLEIYKQLGRVQLRGGQRHEALATWAEVAEQFPGDIPVLQELAELLAAEGQYDAAIERWQQIAENAKDDRNFAVEAERKIAALEALAGRRDEAVGRLDALLNRLEPDGWLAAEVRLQLESLFIQEGDRTGLITYYRNRLESRGDDINTMLSLAAALDQSGDRVEALTLLTTTVERAPQNQGAQQRLIEQLAKLHQYEAAIQRAQAFVDQHPRDVEAIQKLAELEALASTEQKSPALVAAAGETFRQMAAVRADDPALALAAAQACEGAAKRAEWFSPAEESELRNESKASVNPLLAVAESLYREAVRRAPQRPEFHENLGAYLHRHDDPQGATRAWEAIAAGPHDTAERSLQLAEIFNRYEYHDAAIAALRRSLEHAPSQMNARQQLVRWLTASGAFDEALVEAQRLQQMAASSSDMQAALELRVDTLRSARQVEQAIARLQQQATKGTVSLEDHWLLALLWVENRQPQAALGEIEIALSLRPEDRQLLNTTATMAAKAHQTARAIEIYEQLAALDPQRSTVYLTQTVRIHLMQGEVGRARAMAKRIVSEHPSNPTGYRLLAEVSAFSGIPEDRLAALQRAVEVAPTDATMHKQLAELLERRGRDEVALEHYLRAFELVDSDAERLHLISIMVPVAQRTQSYDRLVGRLREVERRRAASPEVALFVVEALRQAGDLQGAFDEVQNVLLEQGDQRGLLDTAVLLAQSLGDFAQAAELQRRVARIAPDRQALEKLAECCMAAGDPEGARQAWRQIVRQMDQPQAIFDVVDAELRRGELVASKLLLSVGLEARPDDWRLLLRAAHVALLEGDDAATRQWLEKVLALPEGAANGSPAMTQASEPSAEPLIPIPAEIAKQIPEVAEFSFASRTLELLGQQRRIAELAARQEKELSKRQADRHRAEAYARLLNHQRAEQQRKVSSQFTMPAAQSSAKVVALCGLWEIARRQGEFDAWLAAQRRDADPPAMARLAVVAFAAEQTELGQQLLATLIDADRESPVPHVLRLKAFQDDKQAARLTPTQRADVLADVEASYAWIQGHRPAWAKPLGPLYWNALLALHAEKRVRAELRMAIKRATRIEELPAWGMLATRLGDLVLQQQVFERAVALPLDDADRAAELAAMRRLLEQRFLYSDDEQYVSAMIAVMNRYFQATQPTEEAIEVELTGPIEGNTPDLGFQFPVATPYIDRQRLNVLSRVHQHCAAASRVFTLQEVLQRGVADSSGLDKQCYTLALAYVQWWAGDLGSSLDTLRELGNTHPSVEAFRVLLCKAYVADGSPELALQMLDALPPQAVVLGDSIARLRREIIATIVADDD